LINVNRRVALLIPLLLCVFLAFNTHQIVRADGAISVFVCRSGGATGCGEVIPVGQPFSVAYILQTGYGGRGTIYVMATSSYAHAWEQAGIDLAWCVPGGCNGWVTAPAISTPGSYVAGLLLTLSDGAVAVGEMPFSVGTSTGSSFDFSLMLSPSTLTVTQGGIANYQIYITYSNPSYSGTTITVQGVTGLGPGMDYQIIRNPPDLSISTARSTPTGSYMITLIGSAMGVVHQVTAVLLVQAAEQAFDFSISVSPTDRTLTSGGSATYAVTVNLVAGAAQNVALSVPDAPAGVTAGFSQTSGTPSFSSTLTVSALQSASPGKYALTVTGIGGGKTHTVPVALIIESAPDFRVEVDPPSQSVLQGQTASYSVNVVDLNGFNSQVSLTVNGLPAGVNGVFSVPSSSPDYSSTLTLTIPGNSPTGSFALTLTGSGSEVTRTANVVLVINPTQTQSQTATTQIAPDAVGGFTETLQQNSLTIIGALVVLVILFGALAIRGRRAVAQPIGAPRTFCAKCGTENPASNKFCASCGNNLKSS